ENNRDPKDFGLPKLTTYLSRVLLNYLGGRFYRSSSQTLRPETGFIFNQVFSSKSSSMAYQIQSDIKSDENLASEKEKTVDEVRKLEENYSASETQVSETDEDIFKPVPPVAQEILNKLSKNVPEKEQVDEEEVAETEADQSFEL